MFPVNILGDNARNVAQALHDLNAGRMSNAGLVTLTENVTSTTVTRYGVAKGDVILLTPQTADAAAELAAGGLYISATAKNEFTITHANDASTDRTFAYLFFARET